MVYYIARLNPMWDGVFTAIAGVSRRREPYFVIPYSVLGSVSNSHPSHMLLSREQHLNPDSMLAMLELLPSFWFL